MTSKVKIKAGAIEIEFEGSEGYVKDELPRLVELLCAIGPASENQEEEESQELPDSTDPAKQKLQLTTNNIAANLSVKTSRELVLAACAHLTLVKGSDNFSRRDILEEMKQANNYYKDTMSKNLSNTLKSLISDNKLLEPTKGKYALQATQKKELETQLSEY